MNNKRAGRWFTGAVAAIVTVAVVLTGHGTGNSGQESTKVRIGEVTRSIFYTPQYVAISKGFFKEEGLDVELTTTFGGDKTMTTLLSGGIDVALVGSETSIYVHQQGSDDPVINFAQPDTDGRYVPRSA